MVNKKTFEKLEINHHAIFLHYPSFVEEHTLQCFWNLGYAMLIHTDRTRFIIWKKQLTYESYHDLLFRLRCGLHNPGKPSA